MRNTVVADGYLPQCGIHNATDDRRLKKKETFSHRESAFAFTKGNTRRSSDDSCQRDLRTRRRTSDAVATCWRDGRTCFLSDSACATVQWPHKSHATILHVSVFLLSVLHDDDNGLGAVWIQITCSLFVNDYHLQFLCCISNLHQCILKIQKLFRIAFFLEKYPICRKTDILSRIMRAYTPIRHNFMTTCQILCWSAFCCQNSPDRSRRGLHYTPEGMLCYLAPRC